VELWGQEVAWVRGWEPKIRLDSRPPLKVTRGDVRE